MSHAPYLLTSAREGYRLGHGQVVDANICDGLWCALSDIHMGETGEIVGEQYHISRQEQDQFALESHRRAIAALDAGKLHREIVPVTVPSGKGANPTVEVDEGPRRDTSMEVLAALRPTFRQQGTVTAGNAPGLSDGAAAVLVASEQKAQELGIEPRAFIEAYATSGVEPRLVMMAPVPAVRRVWELTGWRPGDVDLYEINEAFSVAAIAVLRELGLDRAKVNVHGGAVALGHPIGCTGARILTTLLHALEDRSARRGIAALCLGGGNAVAMAISRQ